MSTRAGTTASAATIGGRRILGHVRGDAPGPTVLLIGGLHGNEPAGVRAIERVFDRFPHPSLVRGEVLGVAGNLAALAAGRRFIDRDLNRDWHPERQRPRTRRRPGPVPVEDAEQDGIRDAIAPVLERAAGPVYTLDLHTTSGPTPPFTTLGDTLRNRAFARAFPLPMVLGLEEQLEATFLEYADALGHITAGFEGGRHDDPAAVDNLEAILWIGLVAAGTLHRSVLPDPARPWRVLRAAADGVPSVVEVRYRYGLRPGQRFVMSPGYVSFQSVREGEVLGTDHLGRPVMARENGRILMPLYQPQGDDGFFVTRPVRPFWLRVSAALRRLRADRLAPLMPGVHRHHDQPETVIIDRRIARWFTVEIFHLLGFRRRTERAHELVMTRRRFDRRKIF